MEKLWLQRYSMELFYITKPPTIRIICESKEALGYAAYILIPKPTYHRGSIGSEKRQVMDIAG